MSFGSAAAPTSLLPEVRGPGRLGVDCRGIAVAQLRAPGVGTDCGGIVVSRVRGAGVEVDCGGIVAV